MKNFRKSLKYVWPYRRRIAVGIAASLGVSLLFTVSIGMLAPILQVITSSEGLRGWVDRGNVESRLGVELAQPDDPTMHGQALAVPIVMKVKDDSVAAAAGLQALDQITAVDGRDVADLPDAAGRLASAPAGQTVRLTVKSPKRAESAELSLALPAASWQHRLFAAAVGWLPAGNSAADRMRALFYILLALLAMTVLRNGLRFLNDLMIEGSTLQAVMDLRSDVYHRLTALPLSHFGQAGVNDAISRVNQDTGQVNVGLTTLFGKTIQEPTKAVLCLAMALWLQWQVVLVAMVGAPLSYLIIRRFGKRMRKAAKRALVSSARMLGVLEETLFGLRVVKAYTMEGYERRRFFRASRMLLREQLRMRRIDAGVSPLLESLGFVGMMAAIMLSAYFVLQGSLNLKLLVAQLGLLIAMGDSMRKLSNVNNRLQHAEAASERVFALMDAEPEPAGLDLPKLAPLTGQIRFEDIRFRYPGAEIDAVCGVSLTVQAGQVVAIVGPNGSGKTTLLSLLPRFFEPAGGRILWDGRDVRQVNLRSLRQNIGLVTQDPVIFADTIEANIRYGNKRIDRQRVVRAACQAHADSFIRQLPDGYDSMVGEHGTTLSGGQKQRLALARAILRNPSVLILDEAMSQVDAESEQNIQQVLDEFLVGRTALIIAHRFTTIRRADLIVVMDAGRIVDVGQHAGLMATCPLYRTLYLTQLRDDAAADQPAGGPAAPAAMPAASTGPAARGSQGELGQSVDLPGENVNM